MKKRLQKTTWHIVVAAVAGIVIPLGTVAGLASAPVADRLVISVSGSSYSQRHIAVWFVVREMLQEPSGKKPQSKPVPFIEEIAASWKEILSQFSDDMVIRQEAARLGSFQPSAKAMMKATERIAARRATDPQLATAATSLALDDEETAKLTATILQVEGFRRSRERQLNTSSRDPSAAQVSWLGDLKSRAVVRVYEGGDSWVSLGFKGEKRD